MSFVAPCRPAVWELAEFGEAVMACGITRAGEYFAQDIDGSLGVLGVLARVDPLCIYTIAAEQILRGAHP